MRKLVIASVIAAVLIVAGANVFAGDDYYDPVDPVSCADLDSMPSSVRKSTYTADSLGVAWFGCHA